MMRVPGDLNAASLGQKTMTRTIHCPHCGVELNVPESAAGRKLKCPKCANKFSTPSVGPGDSVIAEAGPASSMYTTRRGPGSSGSVELPTRRGSSGSIELPFSSPTPSSGDFDLPSSPAPLRDMFDIPLLAEPSPKSSPGQAKAPAPADVMALFLDEPKSNRKPKGAEARSKARRCPSCSNVVGVGMSLCNTCGLDLDTGQRIAPLDIIDDEMPVAPPGVDAPDGRPLRRQPLHHDQLPAGDRLAGVLAEGAKHGRPAAAGGLDLRDLRLGPVSSAASRSGRCSSPSAWASRSAWSP